MSVKFEAFHQHEVMLSRQDGLFYVPSRKTSQHITIFKFLILAKRPLDNRATPRHRSQVQCRNQLQLLPWPQLALCQGLQGPAAHRRVDPRHLRRRQRRRGRARPEDLGLEPAAQGEAQQQGDAAAVKGTGGHGVMRNMAAEQ